MKFCDIMLCCGGVMRSQRNCLAICFVVLGWWVCKVLFVGGANCLALAVLTCD